MAPINRREFVAASGVAVSVLAGCLARDEDGSDADGPDLNDSLSEEVATLLDPIPASVGERSVRFVQLTDPAEYAIGEQDATTGLLSPDLGIETSRIDRIAMAYYGESFGLVTAIVGSFDASDVSDPEHAAVSVSDGLALAASDPQTGWTAGLEAATTAKGDPEVGIDGSEPIEALIGPVADAANVAGIFDLDGTTFPLQVENESEDVDAIATATYPDFEAREQTLGLVVVFAEDASVDADIVEEIIRTGDVDVDPEDFDVTTSDRRALGTVTRDLPHSRLPDNSPDAHFRFDYDPADETVTIVHSVGDAVDAANLELRVGGEPVAAPWESDATIEPGDSYTAEAPPASLVRVVWLDPTLEDVAQPLESEVVGLSRAFEGSYDPDADEITVAYTGDPTLEAEGFVVERWDESTDGTRRERERRLAEYAETLEQGSEFTLSDAQYGDGMELLYEPDGESSLPPETVFRYHVRAPGAFELVEVDGTPSLVYRGQQTVPASDFRVLADGERSDRQWTDVADTLRGDERLGVDAEVGDTIVVEFVDADEPREVFEQTVLPDAEFAFDVGNSTVEITHAGGDSIPAGELAVYLSPAERSSRTGAFSSEYETVAEGDAVTIDYSLPEGADADRVQSVTVSYDGNVLDYAEPGETSADSESANGGSAGTSSGSDSVGGSGDSDGGGGNASDAGSA